MKLRALLLGLLIANLLLAVWSQGWFGGSGGDSQAGRDPGRLTQQVKPQTVRVLRAGVIANEGPSKRPGTEPASESQLVGPDPKDAKP